MALVVDAVVVVAAIPEWADLYRRRTSVEREFGRLKHDYCAAIPYFVYFEGGPTGQTLGKRALGIRVIDLNTGGSIGYARALVRVFASSR